MVVRALWFWLLLIAGVLLAPGALNTARAAPPLPDQVEVYPLGLADMDSTVELVKGVLSPSGKAIPDAANRRIIVKDNAEVQMRVAQIVRLLQVPQKNIRIEVRTVGQNLRSRQAVNAQGNLGRLHVDADNSGERSFSNTVQELVVINNGTAELEVAEEVPYQDWIYSYGLNHGFWGAETKWRAVGAKLRIKPTIFGNAVRIELTPEISHLVEGRPEWIALEKLSTEVIAQDGAEVPLGGVPDDYREFYSKFLVGYDGLKQTRSVQFFVTPHIEEPFVLPQQ